MSEKGLMKDELRFCLEIAPDEEGLRLDRTLARRLPQFSRTTLQGWLRDGYITIDARPVSAAAPAHAGECVTFDLPPPAPADILAEDIPIRVVFEDDTLIVVDKPAGLVVHPGAGCARGTLQNALLHHAPDLAPLARSGIVHRLDKDTSGLLVVARTEAARLALIGQLKTREMGREYEALVIGAPPATGMVDAPIGRDPRHRTRMSVRRDGRPARSDFVVLERLGAYSLLKVRLHSGRTHQIRVHMAHLGFPLVGDETYGGGRTRHLLGRQALHARRLSVRHPRTGELLQLEVPRPDDFAHAITALRHGGGA
ncbi:RluA family pseudouridine synthase [Acidiferrobacter sp.]|uniref:RluA family pseudouridine synthase n=1 Tax=Acidiferrobacter sp. TaxID=1872107 RepID=UPI0026347B13|nr:RluA family pseudouridine synthase [Acidiferrobacter sp.]